jgi:chromosomal replication initiation ATPase DnaA
VSRLDELYRIRDRVCAEIAYIERLGYEIDNIERIRATPVAHIIAAAADLYGVDVDDVLSTSRADRAVRARQGACWLLRGHGMSLPEIGRALGRDHTTVLYACRKIDADPGRRSLLWKLLQPTESVA